VEKKREVLHITTSADEFEKLKRYADGLHLSVSSFSRMLLFKGLEWFEKSFKPNWENNIEVDNHGEWKRNTADENSNK